MASAQSITHDDKIVLTAEQLPIATYDGHRLIVKAFAGTGKTFTLVQYARFHHDKRILYLAYNRAIRDEALKKFPANVDCKTTHQVAFKYFGRDYQHKLSPTLRLRDIADAVDAFNWTLAADIQAVLTTFMASASPMIGAEHYPVGDNAPAERLNHQASVIDAATRIWNRMIDPGDTFVATHDTYLKRFQLSAPDLSKDYDVILMDEAQDQNPCCEAILLGQPTCRIILVGDHHQQIYQFRGAEDAMESTAFHHAEVLRLTQSFRFGPKVAQVANALLGMKSETVAVHGCPVADCVVPAKQFSMKHSPASRITFLARTVMGVLQTGLFFSKNKMPVHLVGGYSAYNFQALEDLYWLSVDKKTRVKDKRLLVEFFCYEQYVEMAKQSGDPEMQRAVKIIGAHPELDKDLALLKQRVVPCEADAAVVVTTAHRAKGLEWPVVYLVDDYPDILSPKMTEDTRKAEVNLLYVASTRAMQMLVVNNLMGNVLKRSGLQGWG